MVNLLDAPSPLLFFRKKELFFTTHKHVLNAPSPAATAALAIGNYVSIEAEKQFSLK